MLIVIAAAVISSDRLPPQWLLVRMSSNIQLEMFLVWVQKLE
jgi:hypothetical protein